MQGRRQPRAPDIAGFKFARVCPEFLIELRSESDRLPALQRKMEKWLANGAQLGWLIDPKKKQAIVYRPVKPREILQEPSVLKGEKPKNL